MFVENLIYIYFLKKHSKLNEVKAFLLSFEERITLHVFLFPPKKSVERSHYVLEYEQHVSNSDPWYYINVSFIFYELFLL